MRKKTFTSSVKSIQGTIYPNNIYIFKGSTFEEIRDWVKSIKPEYTQLLPEEGYENPGFTQILPDGSIILFLRQDYCEDMGVIAHEAFHATEFILAYTGVRHSDESSEAFAYLLQYIVNQIIK